MSASQDPPVVAISYSWDSAEHESWVESLAARLRGDGVDVRLDKWTVGLGGDINAYMESMQDENVRVVAVVTDQYVAKARSRTSSNSGVAIETQILTADTYANLGSNRVIAAVRNNTGSPANLPVYLAGRLFVDFRQNGEYAYEQLLRDLLGRPSRPIPPLGSNPFQGATEPQAVVAIHNNSLRWSSPGSSGCVEIPLNENSGHFTLGSDEWRFPLFIQNLGNHRTRHMRDNFGQLGLIRDAATRPEVLADLTRIPMTNRIEVAGPGDVLVALNRAGYWALMAPDAVSLVEGFNGLAPVLTMRYVIRTDRSPALTLADLPSDPFGAS